MSHHVERQVGRFTIRIDRNLCVGFGDCVTEAAQTFVLAEDGVVVFTGRADDDETVLRACRTCPVDAITAFDEHGNCVAP